MTSEPVQNLALCVTIMAFSGLLRVVATMVLAYPDHLARINSNTSPTEGRIKYITLHVLILALAAYMSIIGSFYGPVSIAIPVQTGMAILFNVAAMEGVLKMRTFNKAERTGTIVVFFSVISLMDVGPRPQDGQNIMHLLSQPGAALWAILITAALILAATETIRLLADDRNGEEEGQGSGSVVSTLSIPLLSEQSQDEEEDNASKIYEQYSFLILLVGATLSNVAMATSGKALGNLSGVPFAFALMYYGFAALLGLLFSITSATACDQGLFTPACSALLIVVNLLTGLIIWEDWKVLNTWVGYLCAVFLMCCGVYLLAEVDLLEQYLARNTIRRRHQDEGSQSDDDALPEIVGLISAFAETEEACQRL